MNKQTTTANNSNSAQKPATPHAEKGTGASTAARAQTDKRKKQTQTGKTNIKETKHTKRRKKPGSNRRHNTAQKQDKT